MNRKQGIIIVVLLALIATAGVLASRLNSPLLNGDVASSFEDQPLFNPEESNIITEEFALAKAEREEEYKSAIQDLKSIIDDEQVSEDTKKSAVDLYVDITMNNNFESKVELALKAKGYEDVVCIIQDNKVNITIKSDDVLEEKQAREIKNEVVRITNLVDIMISVRK